MPRRGRVQITQAERTCTIKYVLSESRRLLHRRRDTKKINIPRCRKKNREKKNEKRQVGSKAQKQARKSYSRRLHSNKVFPSLLQSRDGDLATPSAIFLLSSATVSSVTAAAVEPPPTPANKSTKTKQLPGLGL